MSQKVKRIKNILTEKVRIIYMHHLITNKKYYVSRAIMVKQIFHGIFTQYVCKQAFLHEKSRGRNKYFWKKKYITFELNHIYRDRGNWKSIFYFCVDYSSNCMIWAEIGCNQRLALCYCWWFPFIIWVDKKYLLITVKFLLPLSGNV